MPLPALPHTIGIVTQVPALALRAYVMGEPAATAEALHDGWLDSGDIAAVNELGIYTIVDRKKNMVISGGENIYCAKLRLGHVSVCEGQLVGISRPRNRPSRHFVTSISTASASAAWASVIAASSIRAIIRCASGSRGRSSMMA